jgi:Glycine zipper
MQLTRCTPAALLVLGLAARPAGAQAAASTTQPSSVDQVYKQLGLLAYPSKNQSAQQQEKDKTECYKWSKEQTGWDPLTAKAANTDSAAQAAGAATAQATQGAAVKGAAKGAAAGALIGAAAGDAGKGAAIGAAAGGVGGRSRKKQAEKQAAAQGANQAAAASSQQLDHFKKAVGTCMTGRGYTFSK